MNHLTNEFDEFHPICEHSMTSISRVKAALLTVIMTCSVQAFADNSEIVAEIGTIDTVECPAEFNSIKLPDDGKLCQVFAADFPATMVMHVPKSPEQVLNFYSQDEGAFPIQKTIKSRTILQTADQNTTLIISKDGDGSQVDILVKQKV